MGLDRRWFLSVATAAAAVLGWRSTSQPVHAAGGTFPVALTDAEWEKRLDAAAFDVLRREGTERPFSSPLNREHRPGRFACAGCATPLFSSETKYDSHTGWPSFWQSIPGAVGENRDSTFGLVRVEIHCATCGGHLGHVFNDGPRPTGLRYCMNGVAMRFAPQAA